MATRRDREQLLAEHFGLVRHVAVRLARSLSARAELDELVSAGAMGLLGALESFDPDRGNAFSTYALPRIRGAMLDELRRQDHIPRSLRRRARELRDARERLANALGRRATTAELARFLSLSVETLWRWEAALDRAVFLPLDAPATDARGLPVLVEWLVEQEPDEATIEEKLTREAELRIIREAVKELREQERLVVTLYYLEERTLHEISASLGLTVTRVCQIRARAVAALRSSLAHLRDLAA